MSPAIPTGFPQPPDESGNDAQATLEASMQSVLSELGQSLEVASWEAVKQTLQPRVSAFTYQRYIEGAQVAGSREGVLRLRYPTRFLLDMVRDHYRPRFEEELLLVANRRIVVELEAEDDGPVVDVAAEAAPRAKKPAKETHAKDSHAKDSHAKPAEREPVKDVAAKGNEPPRSRPPDPVGPGEPPTPRRLANGLDTRYSLESFVVGASNQFAYAACKAVADAPGKTYNPLFLWGGVGLGKTHLMQAVGTKALRDRPGSTVIYTSSEQFTNELISAIQNKRMPEFRKRYRDCDVLLIDDVQFLAGKPATEEEFFHTFNALHSQGKQIIVSSDTVPHEIDDMEERLRSRFQWGLIADIQPPEMETRVAILKSKAAAMRLELADDVAQFLAAHIRQNVRELEGSLLRIAAFANIMKGPISVEVCKDVLKSLLVNKGQRVDVDQIVKACADYFKVTVAEIRGPVRQQHIARARQAAMYLARNITGESYPVLGRKFDKDHSTVINAIRRVPELMQADPEFRRGVETLERELNMAMS